MWSGAGARRAEELPLVVVGGRDCEGEESSSMVESCSSEDFVILNVMVVNVFGICGCINYVCTVV